MLPPVSRATSARTPSTWSGSTLIRKWFGASGGRLARQLARRSPRTSVSSSSAIRPSASAPTCSADPTGRRRRLASPNRHVTPRCGRRLSKAITAHAANAATTSSPPMPPTMIAAILKSCACQPISPAITPTPST
jgi:hypothetical protein